MAGEHERLKQYFTDVVELEPGARDARLIEIKDVDPELYIQLLGLLEQDEHSTCELFDSGETVHTFCPDSSLHHGAIPDTIGSYRVIRLLGRGATSRVFEVEQNQPRRRIALKLLDDEVSSNASYYRFSREIDALARMNHDGIAHVYEAGTEELDGRGRPFFTMELVEGKPITRYARDAGLSNTAKLGMIARVADAAHHAHLRGVVHRDLKPSNILVTEDGRPVVLDFGVAKLQMEDPDTPTVQTETGRIIGTLAYMSPEQVRSTNGLVDLRSDVYSLGAIAYELLCDRMPVATQDVPLHLALLSIQTDIPPGLGSLDRALSGDVETIIACALSKNPTERYGSADEMASDIRRHLGSEAIHIVPTRRIVCIKKYVRRNRLAIASVGAIAIALSSGAAVATWQASIATTRLAELTSVTDNLRSVTEFQSQMFRFRILPRSGTQQSTACVHKSIAMRLKLRTDRF